MTIDEIRKYADTLRPYVLKASENGLSPDEAKLLGAVDFLLSRVEELSSLVPPHVHEWVLRLESENAKLETESSRLRAAWDKVRTRVICTVDPACGEHTFADAMAAVAEMDAALRPARQDTKP